MMITRIDRIREHRIFREFDWPDGLPDFGRFNLIYGWNAAGKTTLSNLFRLIGSRGPLIEGKVEFSLEDGSKLSATNLLEGSVPPIRVFNRASVSASIFESPGQQLSPIYYLGEDSADKQRQVVGLRADLDAKKAELAKAFARRRSMADGFEDYCTDRARTIRESLAAPGGAYLNYDKRDFKSGIGRIGPDEVSEHRLTEGDRSALKAVANGKPRQKIARSTLTFPSLPELTSRTIGVLRATVVSGVLNELSSNSEIAAWVQSGLALHLGPNASGHCRFCSQPIPAGRIAELEGHFNDQLKRFQGELAQLSADIEAAIHNLENYRPSEKGELYEHLQDQFGIETRNFNMARTNVMLYLRSLRKAVDEKLANLFQPLEWEPLREGTGGSEREDFGVIRAIVSAIAIGVMALSEMVGEAAYQKIEALLAAHDAYTDNFYAEISGARKKLELSYVAEFYEGYHKKKRSMEEAALAHKALEISIVELQKKIADLERDVKQHRRPADELTREVKGYLGHDELVFQAHDTGYSIQRSGLPATDLSDGERTAISLLYFLKSLGDTSFQMGEGIVVIDDPISSLDANALFAAFGFVKDRTKDAGQLFVLTHNFAFFRQVRNWFHHMQGQRKKDVAKRPARFYMLSTERSETGRRVGLRELDPFLHRYESEYHFLFRFVHDEANRQGDTAGLGFAYGVPNIARRVLEAFLAFRIPGQPIDLNKRFEKIDFDAAKKARILRFLHTHSHHDLVADPEHDSSILAETRAVLLDVLLLIESVDPVHYKGMVELLSAEDLVD